MPTDLIRVILADDHAVVRQGIRDFLIESGDIDVITEAADGEKAIALIDQLRPWIDLIRGRSSSSTSLLVYFLNSGRYNCFAAAINITSFGMPTCMS